MAAITRAKSMMGHVWDDQETLCVNCREEKVDVRAKRCSAIPPRPQATRQEVESGRVAGACCILARDTKERCVCRAIVLCPMHGRSHVGSHE